MSCFLFFVLDSVGLRNKFLRKVEELKLSMVCTGIPDEFLCPITREMMKDPVIAAGRYISESPNVSSVLYLSIWLVVYSEVTLWVFVTDGYSYERDAIEGWISSRNRSSPMTNLPLQTTVLTPNRTLKMAIGRWKASQP